MPTTERFRDRNFDFGRGEHRAFRPSNNVDYFRTFGSAKFVGRQLTVSEGHPFKHKFEGVDQGGDFFTTKKYVKGMDPTKVDQYPDTYILGTPNTSVDSQHSYTGPVFPGVEPYVNNFGFPYSPADSGASSDAALIALGTSAIARCKPGQPVANLSVALAELMREGLPSMIGHTLWEKRARELGPPPKKGSQEYLNWVFGWKPLIADIKDAVNGLRNQDQILSQYERDAGKLVRRRYDFPIDTQTSVETFPGTYGVFGTHAGAIDSSMYSPPVFSQGTLTKTIKVTKERWFSGAFTYYLPGDYNSRNELKRAASRARILLGVELTPEVVWNLIPWSWAVDWFANVGDVLSNVSDFALDDQVMWYGYMMETSITEWTWSLRGHACHGVQDPLSMTFGVQSKRRIQASPYGFGLTWDSFSPRQLAILAALGINRVL